jgi:hypothetical protein
MSHLKGFEVIGGFWRYKRLLYANTPFDCFFYGQSTASKIVWRFYWLTPSADLGK